MNEGKEIKKFKTDTENKIQFIHLNLIQD